MFEPGLWKNYKFAKFVTHSLHNRPAGIEKSAQPVNGLRRIQIA